jgi:pimeloyl-ACP methyl ester carboxylesterase
VLHELADDLVRGGQDDVGEQPLLVGEVPVDGLLGHRGQGRDLVHAGAEVAVAQEGRGGRLHDQLALACRAGALDTVVSHDGTTIALDRAQLRPPGPRRQRRHRAVCGRPRDEDLEAVIDAAGGSASLFGNSGGGILALEAAARGLAVTRIAVWEPPYIIDGSRPPVPADYRRQLGDLPAAGATWSSCS